MAEPVTGARKAAREAARAVVLDRFRWVDGHADIWPVLGDAAALRTVVLALAAPFRAPRVDVVAAIEARAFLLAGAVAIELGTGVAAIRKDGSSLRGDLVRATAEPDYLGRTHTLVAARGSLPAGARVLLVDDWIELGAQARAAGSIVEECGAVLAGVSVIVDQSTPPTGLPPIESIVSGDELERLPGGALAPSEQDAGADAGQAGRHVKPRQRRRRY